MRALAAHTCDVDCPVRRSVDVLASKWTLLIVRDLLVETQRFGELLIPLGGLSPKVLTDLGGPARRGGMIRRGVPAD